MIVLKSTIRQIYLQKRKALNDTQIAHFSEQICKMIFKEFISDKEQNIHLFLPIAKQKEIDLWFLIRMLFSENQANIFVPKISNGALQTHILTQDSILKENIFGVLEPTDEPILEKIEFDFIITPLIYCDKFGDRVGYGKGFYDRFFNSVNQNALKIGVSFFEPKEIIADVSPMDISLDFLVTPKKIFKFEPKERSAR